MFVSVYANVHYHRYLGPRVAGGSILATSAAVLLLAATLASQMNLVCDLGLCTYFQQNEFYLRTDHTNQLLFVKLREREGQRVDLGRSLKGHL